jgi:hypothetical protein
MRRSDHWHISGWPAAALALVLSPLIALRALVGKIFPRERRTDRTPGEVAGFIKDFLDSTGGDWDWDDFTSVPIRDLRLDQIRVAADMISLPLDDDGKKKLTELMQRALALRPLS